MVQCLLPVALLAETLRINDDGAVTQCPIALLGVSTPGDNSVYFIHCPQISLDIGKPCCQI